MKVSGVALTSLATLATAAPAAEPAELAARQLGACEVGFVFARGSTEPAPIGFIIGPSLQSSLKSKVRGVTTYPVYYSASIGPNISIQRTDQASINQGVRAFKQAANCKVIVAGGYSQGAAVMHNVISKSLDATLKAKIAGVALFGDTRNLQDSGHIPNFPREKSKVWCNLSDGVCTGGLNVNTGHLSYSNYQISEAATWLAGRIKAHGGK